MIINPYRYATGGGGGPVIEAYAGTVRGGDSTITLVAPSGITSGELLLAFLSCENSPAAPSGWTVYGVSGSGTNARLYYKVSDGTETDLGFFNSGGACGWYMRVSGHDGFNILGTRGTNSGTSHTISEATTTVDNCLALYFFAFDGGDGLPFTISGTDWIDEDQIQDALNGASTSGCFGQKAIPTAGATVDVGVTSSVSDGSAYFQVAIAPA